MKTIILAGGGHGHINILKNLIKKPLDDFKVILITDYKRQYYSGMLAGFIEGLYTEDDMSFDIKSLCSRAEVAYVEEKIVAIDRVNKKILTKNSSYGYDFLSINLGSLSNINFPIDSDYVSLVKPIKNIVDASRKIETLAEDNPRIRLAFVGGGASGVELSLAFRAAYPRAEIDIITSNDILGNFNPRARKKFYKILRKKNINIIKNHRVIRIVDKKIFTNYKSFDFDYAFVSSGFSGPDIDFLGFNTDDRNYLMVDDRLFADENSLAMGDLATMTNFPNRPKAGVFAIRQAPILYNNLLELINGGDDFKAYSPQEKYLQILNCGNKKALSHSGNFSNYGRISWLIKDKIDRDYMKVD